MLIVVVPVDGVQIKLACCVVHSHFTLQLVCMLASPAIIMRV
jgi:hypothetical protein